MMKLRPLVKISCILTLVLLFSALLWSTSRIILYHDQGSPIVRLANESELETPLQKQAKDHYKNLWMKEATVQESRPAEESIVEGVGSYLLDIQNATLGFQKIYVLSMPNRRDKRDIISLSASLTGLEFEFVDGVDGSLISKAERPDGWESEFNTDGNVLSSLGCWRGHMDIYQKMTREHIQTALIMEDDSDWDVMIKSQFTELARGARHLQNRTDHQTPYGDDWWILTTGHCALSVETAENQTQWVVDNDPTVVPESHRQVFYGPDTRPKEIAGKNTRLIYGHNFLVCTGSYAISRKGVANVLYDQEVLSSAKPIDLALGTLCSHSSPGRCLGVWPPLTGIFVPAGDKSKEPDRQISRDGERNEVAWSKNTVYSTRLNLARLLTGNTTVESQYPEDSMFAEIDASTFQLPKGRAVLITAEEYEKAKEIDKQMKEEEMLKQSQEAKEAWDAKLEKEEEHKDVWMTLEEMRIVDQTETAGGEEAKEEAEVAMLARRYERDRS